MASICGSPVCAGGKPKLKFTYTGDYVVRKDGVVELLTSGTIVFLEPKVIDVFMVGGGGGGASFKSGESSSQGYGGGAGGYTRTIRRVSIATGTSINVTVGAGGAAQINGNSSAMGSFEVSGGYGASGGSIARKQGGSGGSGGGGGVDSNSDYGTGGSDGANGEHGFPTTTPGGAGQGFSTREFGESTGKLYAGGGGGGRYMSAQSPIVSMGGPGGGGSGGFSATSTIKQAAAAGVANTGGGGGGGSIGPDIQSLISGGSGGSGIVCFRDAQELPELAGTWVLNERLYAPESTIVANVNATISTGTTSEASTKFTIGNGEVKSSNRVLYQFTNNAWIAKYKYWTFPTGATASDEFRAWLASNATKQA
jgi:hypothetical protein